MQKTDYPKLGETLYSEVLPNGLKINVVPKPQFTKSFAMFAVSYGGADRRFRLGDEWIDTPAGVAHFLEHKLFDMPDGNNALAGLSARGASPNAFTSSAMTAYYFEGTGHFTENLRTLLEFVSTPYFTPESVQKERGIIGQEIRMVEDNPGHAVYYNLLRSLYAANPARDSVAGTIESIAEITSEVLYHCHSVFYKPSNMTLSVVGNVDPEEVATIAREVLSPEPGETPVSDYGPAETDFPVRSTISAEMEVSAPQFLFGAKLTPAADGAARLRQQLTGEIALRLLLGPSSSLYNSLYAAGLLNGPLEYEIDYTAGTAMLIGGGESRKVEEVMAAMQAEVEKIRGAGLDAASFENIRKAYYGAKLRQVGSFSSLAQALAEGAFAGFSPLSAPEEISKITLDEVQRFILESITAEKLALSVVKPLEK